MRRPPPRSPLFPYTTLFRSRSPEDTFGLLRELLEGIESRLRNVQTRSEEHTSELQSQSNLVCRLLLEKKKVERRRLRVHHVRQACGLHALGVDAVARARRPE